MEEDRATNQRSAFLLSFTLALYINITFGLRVVTDIDVKLFQCHQDREIVVKWFVQFPEIDFLLLEYAHQPKRLHKNFKLRYLIDLFLN